jgi:3-(3-hydroxy-phenyl)propionate hydroxylase
VGGQWAVLHTGVPPVGVEAWAELGARVIRLEEDALIRWMQRKKAAAVVLRPDGFIYAASDSGKGLPPPPEGMTGNITPNPSRSGATA